MITCKLTLLSLRFEFATKLYLATENIIAIASKDNRKIYIYIALFLFDLTGLL